MKQRTKTKTASRNKSKTHSSRSKNRKTTALRASATRTTDRSKRSSASRSARSRSAAAAVRTTDHHEIQQWVESHGGHPALVKGTKRGSDDGGILRIDFPGFSGEESLAEISWEKWFDIFEERELAFLYQRGGAKKQSRFNKLVSR
jgi:hypothetical protein